MLPSARTSSQLAAAHSYDGRQYRGGVLTKSIAANALRAATCPRIVLQMEKGDTWQATKDVGFRLLTGPFLTGIAAGAITVV